VTLAVAVPELSDFPIDCLPYCLFSTGDGRRRIGVAIGDDVLDAAATASAAGLPEARVLGASSLNDFMAGGPASWRRVRELFAEWLSDGSQPGRVEPYLRLRRAVSLHLPFEVADYVDFYSSEHHARNLGQIFRPDSPPLTPNWKHLPVGYHGRAGTVVVSGTPVIRPRGQRGAGGGQQPAFGASERLDIEAEVGFVVGVGSRLGEPVPIGAFTDHVFGAVLLNDWSARDIQAFEYVPLGPFLGKSFATSVSPFVVPMAALEAARLDPPPREPAVQDYLADAEPWGLDLSLEIEWNGTVVSRPPFSTMYWTPAQQLAHMTVNGASLRTGDLYGSGTVSGPGRAEQGSFVELTLNGTEPLSFPDGTKRGFLADGDVVRIRATAPGASGHRLGFGEVVGEVRPAPPC
jgi:fumarylacetoacetase